MTLRFSLLGPLWVLLILCSPGLAFSQDADTLWLDATTKMGQSKELESVVLLQRLSEQYPEHALTDDALFLAATLLEEKLGKPGKARELYLRLVQTFPDSRSALAAQRRLVRLEKALGHDGKGAKAAAAFQDIMQRYPQREAGQSLALAQALLKEHAGWSESYRVRLWIAESARRLGDLNQAAPLFEEVRTSEVSDHAVVQATLGGADVQILLGNWDAAKALLDGLAQRPNLLASDVQALEELQLRLQTASQRSSLLRLSYVLVCAMLLLLLALAARYSKTWSALAKNLVTPPIEILYMLPFAALFIVMALTGHQEVGPAVAIISGGGLVVTWLMVTALRVKPLTQTHALICGTAATLAMLSLCYLALHRSQLLDLLWTTLEFGPE